MKKTLIMLLHEFLTFNFQSISALMGIGEFLPSSAILTIAGETLCRDDVVFQPICSNILFLIGGWNEEEHNAVSL